MKAWSCRITVALLALLLAFPAASARRGGGYAAADTAKAAPQQPKISRFWTAITPQRIVAQYAGGIGFASAGVGWAYGKDKAWETDMLLGYVPPYHTNRGKLTFTARESYAPFDFRLYRGLRMRPLAASIYLNAIAGHEFWTNEPSRYPKKYYGFSTGVRIGVSLGQRLSLRLPQRQGKPAHDLIFYYDLNSCDLDIATWSTNNDIKLRDIVNLSFGLKITLF